MWLYCGLVRTRTGLLQARQLWRSSRRRRAGPVPGPRQANPAWQQALDVETR